MGKRFEQFLTAVMTLSLVVIASTMVKRGSATAEPPRETSRFVEDWETTVRPAAVPISAGKVSVIVVTDFQCPFCAKLDSSLSGYEKKNPGVMARSIVHFPIESHTFAYPAARAFECARAQGRAAGMHASLYANQRRLGLEPWAKVAQGAGVADIAAFLACHESNAPVPAVEAGLAAGKAIDVRGTPTVLVNGWMMMGTYQQVIRAVEAAANGESPKQGNEPSNQGSV